MERLHIEALYFIHFQVLPLLLPATEGWIYENLLKLVEIEFHALEAVFASGDLLVQVFLNFKL